jgi:hypothetical protein
MPTVMTDALASWLLAGFWIGITPLGPGGG